MINKELQQKIEVIIKELKNQLGEAKVYVIHEDGQLIATTAAGKESVEFASITASWYSAAKMLYECLGKKDMMEVGQWGIDSCIFSFPLPPHYLLAVISEKNKYYPGWILMKCQATVADLNLILDKKVPTSLPTEKKLFENISDREIDDLFGGL